MLEYISDGSGFEITEVNGKTVINIYRHGVIISNHSIFDIHLTPLLLELEETETVEGAVSSYIQERIEGYDVDNFHKGIKLYIAFLYLRDILPFKPCMIHDIENNEGYLTQDSMNYYLLQVTAYREVTSLPALGESNKHKWLLDYCNDLYEFLLLWSDFFPCMEIPLSVYSNLAIYLPSAVSRYHMNRIVEMGTRLENILLRFESCIHRNPEVNNHIDDGFSVDSSCGIDINRKEVRKCDCSSSCDSSYTPEKPVGIVLRSTDEVSESLSSVSECYSAQPKGVSCSNDSESSSKCNDDRENKARRIPETKVRKQVRAPRNLKGVPREDMIRAVGSSELPTNKRPY